jgi:Type II CAAX prenyl endopeptidase Rce1-like
MSSASTSSPPDSRVRTFPWRVFWFLFVASLAGGAAALPMAFEIFRPVIKAAPPPNIPLPLLISIGVAQNAALLGLAVGVGLMLARKLGLGVPLVQSCLYHEPWLIKPRESLVPGAMAGLAVGLILLVPLLLAAPYLPGLPFVSAARAPVWKRVLVGFYGGIDEEVIARLFLLSLVAWIGMKVFRKQQTKLSPGVFWLSNIIVAILFGLGHLPSAAMVMTITPFVIFLALVLNGIAAVTFGYLYRKRGLEAAMIAHFCADFVLYAVGPAFLRFVPVN